MEVQLGDLFLNKGGSVNPAKHPEETFEYYSIPAYDTGEPEIILGSGIGSSKKVFKPNDIILSRIVPHIRRCWVVGPDSGYRQIGSGEWITFRSEKIEPSFLKHYLMSNEFNAKFLKTIKGVGGSLMRADPKQVAKFNLILPPLDQQKKIAAILDAADAYRQKTKALIEKYEELTQSLFLDMFGDPVTNPKGWDKLILSSCFISKKEGTKCGPFGSALKKHEYVDNGIPVWTMYNIKADGFNENKCLFITPEKYDDLASYETKFGDIIISRAGTIGKMCVVTYAKKAIISTNLIRLRLDTEKILPMYFSLLMNKWGPKIARLKTGADGSFTHMNTGILNGIVLSVPPLELQNQFAERVQAIEAQKAQAQASLAQAEDLFNSLLQRAFKGELS